jgi:Zn-dependent protease with chaperone function
VIAGLRALLSVLMLAGFYVVGLLQLAVAGALAFWLTTVMPAGLALKLTLPLFVALIGGAGVALWKALRARTEPMEGVILTPDQAPQLWGEVRSLAEAAGTRAPDEIRIIGDVNAAVSEHAKLLGLIPGRRYLYLGLPLMAALTVDQFRAVVAHELGHYSGSHTRLGAVAYRGRLAIEGTLSRISSINPVGWLFRGYARLYLLVDNAVARRQELEADAAAVRVAGKRAAIGALTELSVASAAYNFYLGRYVAPGAEFGLLPDNIFGGFSQLLTARTDELAELREEAPEQEEGSSRWNTHPPLSQRIAAINALPDVGHRSDSRRSTDLMPDAERIGRSLQQVVVQTSGREVLPWEDFASASATRGLQAQADSVFRDISRKLNQPNCGLPQVFSALEAGRAGELGEIFYPNATRKEAAGRFANPLTMLLGLAALRSSRAMWKPSWSEQAKLVGMDGEPLSLNEVAKLAVDPATLPQALTRLKELGIQIEAAPMVENQATARGAEVIAGLSNTKFGGVDVDLYVLDNGLLAVRTDEDSTEGRKRMLTLLEAADIAELAKQHPFLAFENVKKVTISKKVPLRATIELHNGKTFDLKESWSGDELHKHSREVLTDIFKQYDGL